jgi:uncharacterized phage-like protein YoqJ
VEILKSVFFTGHRPHGLWGQHFYSNSKEVKDKYKAQTNVLVMLVSELVVLGFHRFITGGAIGLDQMAAETVVNLRDSRFPQIALVIARPFPSQDAVWPQRVRDDFIRLCNRADLIRDISPDPYAPWKMQKRNEWMVDEAQIGIAMWSGSKGGTYNCVEYAQKKGKPIIVVHPHTLEITRINC